MKTNAIGPYELGRVHHADCLDAMRELPDGCVQSCVTSPPYWGLRKYDVPETVWGGDPTCKHEWGAPIRTPWANAVPGPSTNVPKNLRGAGSHWKPKETGPLCSLCGAWRGQLGLEPTPDLYVSHMVAIFREVWRVLRDDGTLWLNIGDCYHSGDRGGYRLDSHRWEKSPMQAARKDSGGSGVPLAPNRLPVEGLKDKDLVGIPWILAFALRADGWFLRAEIIWHKTAPMPESVRDRPTRAHEQVFLLSRSADYFYDHEAASDEAANAGHVVSLKAKSFSRGQASGSGRNPSGNGAKDEYSVAPRRNWRTVWTIGPEPNNAQHYAPFPRELARRCIVAGSRVGDVVLDPFAGTGTTVRVADGLQRKAIGFDLGEGYVIQANERSGALAPSQAKIGQQAGLFAEVDK